MRDTGTTQIGFRIPNDLLKLVDAYAASMQREYYVRVTRTMAIERLLQIGLGNGGAR